MLLKNSELKKKIFQDTPIHPIFICPGDLFKLAAPWEVLCFYQPESLANAIGPRERDWNVRWRRSDRFKGPDDRYRVTLPEGAILYLESYNGRWGELVLAFRIYSTGGKPIYVGGQPEKIRRKLRPKFWVSAHEISGLQILLEVGDI